MLRVWTSCADRWGCLPHTLGWRCILQLIRLIRFVKSQLMFAATLLPMCLPGGSLRLKLGSKLHCEAGGCQDLPGAARSSLELPGAARSCQELPGAARSCQEFNCQELPGAARSCQELPGAARNCQALAGAARSCQELPECASGAARSCQELPGAARSRQELP